MAYVNVRVTSKVTSVRRTVKRKKIFHPLARSKIRLQFQPSIDPNDIPYEQIIAWWNKDIYVFMYSTKRL